MLLNAHSTVLCRREESQWNGISRRLSFIGRQWTKTGGCGRGSRLWELCISPLCCLRTSETACIRNPSLNTSTVHLPPWKTTSTTNNNKLSTLPFHSSFACATRRRARSEDKVRVPQDAKRADFVRNPAGCPVRAAPAHFEGRKRHFY